MCCGCKEGTSPTGVHERISWGSQVDLGLEGLGAGQHYRPQVRKVQPSLCDNDNIEFIYVEKRAIIEGFKLKMCTGVRLCSAVNARLRNFELYPVGSISQSYVNRGLNKTAMFSAY